MTRLFFLFFLIPFALRAQSPSPRILCGNEVLEHLVHDQYPDLDAAFEQTFEQTRARVQRGSTDDRSVMTINVVVHVVWKTPEENLADSIIANQIAILNRDFNRENPDSVNTRTLFKPVAGNAGIRFKLAGIVRKQTTKNFAVNLLGGSLLPELKSTASGGSDGWDVKQYMNIWVCNVRPATILGIPLAQILGFAFPPNGLANWPAGASAPKPEEDGVVVDYRVLGSNNPNTITIPGGTDNLTVRGRTTVHEVGHYLGLRHIWGDGGGLLSPTNDCKQSDGVNDTPFANAQSNFDCDKSRNSCTGIEAFYNADAPDMTENYMDYSREDCMNMFTKGQVALMRATLSGPRSGLLTPVSTRLPADALGLELFPNPASDLAVLRFDLPEATEMSVQVSDVTGKIMLEQPSEYRSSGAQMWYLPTESLPTGWYAVQVRTNKGIAIKSLLVTNP
jgi:hypothetical protein